MHESLQIVLQPTALGHRLLNAHRFAVVNPHRPTTLLEDFEQHALAPPGLALETHLLPTLLPLNESNGSLPARRRLVDAVARVGDDPRPGESEPPLVFLIATEADESSIRRHLSNHLTIRLPAGRCLLRWYDPAVFVQLMLQLRIEQIRKLFGPIDRISFWWQDNWYSVMNPGVGEAHWRFDEADNRKLADIELVNRVLREGTVTGLPDLLSTSRSVLQTLARARTDHGLVRADDLVAFAKYALTIHPQFDRHQQMEVLLERLDDTAEPDAQTFEDACMLLSDEDWQRIRRDLDRQIGADA